MFISQKADHYQMEIPMTLLYHFVLLSYMWSVFVLGFPIAKTKSDVCHQLQIVPNIYWLDLHEGNAHSMQNVLRMLNVDLSMASAVRSYPVWRCWSVAESAASRQPGGPKRDLLLLYSVLCCGDEMSSGLQDSFHSKLNEFTVM